MGPESGEGRDRAASDVPVGTGADSGECPEIDFWLRMVSGELTAAEADALLTHAATCRPCLEKWTQCRHVLRGEAEPEEAAMMLGLVSASEEWQHRLARQLAGTPRTTPSRWTGWQRVSLGLVPVTIALAVLALIFWHRHQTSPERLLAQAYTRDRIFDLRMAGAGFAPVANADHLRGNATHRETASLLSARASIERKLETAPTDPHWLQLRARAQLMEEDYDAAIDVLDRLLGSGPVSASLLVDDASAYFERGTATGSENDRATALDYLRRADEIAPDDPVVLFNEALVMEDRAQLMNAIETWNRYLKFERDPQWLAEGRQRLQNLEAKLDKLKSHQSRMEQHLASPAAMRVLAADPATLASLDEELSTTMLPRLLDAAFPLPADRSRGSPCDDRCRSARTLLTALAASLDRHHRDPWLHQLLPSATTPPAAQFAQAAQELARALDADSAGDSLLSRKWALAGHRHFLLLGNAAGADRAWLENAYDLQRLGRMKSCYLAAHALIGSHPQYAWIQSNSLTEAGICDHNPGAATQVSPLYVRAASIAQTHQFSLLTMRIQNQLGGAAVESGDAEDTWRIFRETLRQFYAGDYPPFRAYTILSGLAEVEKDTPRLHLELLLQRELLSVLELTPSRQLIPSQRYDLAIAAIRAGYIPEAQQQLLKVRSELTQQGGGTSIRGFLADSEIAMANLYLSHEDLPQADALLESSREHIRGLDDDAERSAYAAARGQLQLARGQPAAAEGALREAILAEESQGRRAGAGNIIFARNNRALYATLAGIWMAEGRPGIDILALWERYRLRILGQSVPNCIDRGLDCLRPRLARALASQLGPAGKSRMLGEVVLPDRVLLYRADSHGVVWTQLRIRADDLLSAEALLEQEVGSPATSLASVHQAARCLGQLLVDPLHAPDTPDSLLLIEPDPLLGNLPWPAVETADGPIGLRFNLEEAPSLLLHEQAVAPASLDAPPARPLIVGASIGAGLQTLLPEVLQEARAVARLDPRADLLLAGQATEEQVAARLPSASLVHFAGHAAQFDGATRLLLAPARAPDDKPYLDTGMLRKDPPRDARLVVFSACSTGKSEAGWNHGMGDIVDTLASLGVPEVVATRWQIDSASAVSLMSSFYRGLADGLNVPQALTAARQTLSRDARYRHPYYWAAYYASGVEHSDLRALFRSGAS